jgi:ribonucleoside-triphosphate reductase
MSAAKSKFFQVQKRDGRIVDFDQSKITKAIFKALTATKKGGKRISQKLSDQVVDLLNRRFKKGVVSQIEEIQDVVEEVLIINGYTETAKSYILYREQRRRIREATTAIDEAVKMVDQYIQELDWQIKENANMAYSLQGLNHYVVSAVTKKYWLNKIYPKEIREAVDRGDFHIHDLDSLSCYCQGWDLYDLLIRGFGGVKGKVESKPANHLRTALGQLVNFFYTLQGETAGAEAISNFDTLLAPFIRYDNLNYNQVKQAMQEFLFNCAVPTRVGFQCISEDTEILTSQGWRGYQDVNEGDIIKTFNLETRKIENQKVNYVFKKKYSGLMYRLKNRIQDQLISPNHRVVRKKFQTDKCVLETVEEVAKLKSPFAIPIAGGNSNKTSKISDEQIKLMAWIISEGTVERPGKHRSCYRISIYQSKIKNPKHYKEIIGLLKHFNLEYSESETASLGDNVRRMRMNAESSRKIHKWFGTRENVHFIPDDLLNLDARQSQLFIETYLKGDGFEGCKISVTDLELLDGLQIICVNSSYGFTVLKRKPTIGEKDIFVLRLIKHTETYIPKVEKVNYKGIIWSPNTKNETVVARRKGKVFITGNTPFINITLDIKPSKSFAKQPVIVGGKPQKEIYAEFTPEMNMLNKAFYECLMEGDKSGRPFTFPIPTVSITKDFDWDNPALEPMWQATVKYGVNYFSNFVKSDMNPDDIRAMCCRLQLDKRELYRRGGGLFGSGTLTGSIGVVTINMPRIGYQSKTRKEFFDRLGSAMDLAKESLEIKRKVLENFMEKRLYPYSEYYLSGIKKMRGEYFGNHFSTIGLVGMNEALLNFTGVDIGSRRGRRFTLEVLDFMRDRLVRYQKETNNLYNLEATPAEGTSYRLALRDKEKYPDIITAGTKKTPYYTNSTMLSVNYTDDVFEALKLQDEIQSKYTGGIVFHIFLGERVSDIQTIKNLIKKIFGNFHLPYITFTPTFSICPHHGYISGEHFNCPKCVVKQPCEVYSRVVGYIRPVQQWHIGKKEEFKNRKVFKIKR